MHNSADQIGTILKTSGITQEEINKRAIQSHSIKIYQKDKNTGEILASFNSMNEAARCMRDQGHTHCIVSTGASHISQVCQGKRKTFAGYAWSK